MLMGMLFGTYVSAGTTYKELPLEWKRQWEALLHYEGGRSVIAPESDFFLSKAGAQNPAVELSATLAYFQQDSRHQCEYPARAYLLTGRVPANSCRVYREFERYVALDDVRVVFASESETSPVSSMGHVFLVLGGVNSLGVYKQHAAAFVADTAKNKNLLMDFLQDQMIGSYVLMPYDDWIYQYVSKEERSLWEYELDLNDSARQWLRLHLFELKEHNIKYSFFTHNCADGLAQVLGAADADLSVSEPKAFLTPVQYTQHIVQAGKVKSITLRPSQEDARRLRQGVSPDPLKTPAPTRWQLAATYHSDFGGGIQGSFLPFFSDIREGNPAQSKLSEVKFLEVMAKAFHHQAWVDQITLVNIRSLPNIALAKPKLNIGVQLHGNEGIKHTSLRPDIHIGTGLSYREKGVRPFWSMDVGVYWQSGTPQYYAQQQIGIYYSDGDFGTLQVLRQDSISSRGDYRGSPGQWALSYDRRLNNAFNAFVHARHVDLSDSDFSEVTLGISHRF